MLALILISLIAGLIVGVAAKVVMGERLPSGTSKIIWLSIGGAFLGFVIGAIVGRGDPGLSLLFTFLAPVAVLAIYRRRAAGPSKATTEKADSKSPPVSKPPPVSEYDVFISYRRAHGAETARLLRSALEDKGVRAFLDIEDLRAGHFNRELLTRIAEAPSFLIVLTPQALDRCVAEDDWLRQEIVQAIKTRRNIVPLMMPGFQFPDRQAVPENIRGLNTYQSVGYSHEFFDAMVDRIVRFLQ